MRPSSLVCTAATLLAVIVAGLAPALQSTRGDVRQALSTDTATASPRWRGQRVLIVAQVTTSVVLLVLTAVSLQELRRQATWDAGLDLDRVAVARVNFSMQGYDAPRAYEALLAVRSLLQRQPGVESVAIATAAPVFALPAVTRFTTAAGTESHSHVIAASPDLVQRSLGIELRHGDMWPNHARADETAVVSETAAVELFGTTNVVGQSIWRWRGDASRELRIAGVTGDTSGDASDRNIIYVPLDATMDQSTILPGLIVARTATDPSALLPVMRQEIAAIDPALAVATFGTGRTLAGGSTVEFYRITAGVAGGLGSCAWVLALAGLYGVLSHLVQRRRREIGLRMALGAARQDVIRMVLRDGLRPLMLGIGCGLALAVVAGLLLPAQFARLLPTIDPMALAILPPLFSAFAGAAILACYLPARRASRVDPNVALKEL